MQKIEVGKSSKTITSTHYLGTTSFVDTIETDHPGYLHRMYLASTQVFGCKADLRNVADHMNTQNAVPSEFLSATQIMNNDQLNKWFKVKNGKQVSLMEKPFGIAEHCVLRKDWVVKWHGLLTRLISEVYYIDEKWFYTTNRRQKLKKLLLGEHEYVDADCAVSSNMISYSYPIKSMFMAVIGRHVLHRRINLVYGNDIFILETRNIITQTCDQKKL